MGLCGDTDNGADAHVILVEVLVSCRNSHASVNLSLHMQKRSTSIEER
jgi:hypothetical protein